HYPSRSPIEVARPASLYCRYSVENLLTVVSSWGEATHAAAATAIAAQRIMRLVLSRRCNSAKTAIMIGIVTSAVLETMTNVMLTTKLTPIMETSSASQIRLVR